MNDTAPQSIIRRFMLRSLATAGVTAAVGISWWKRVEAAREPDGPPQTTLGMPLDLGRVILTPMSLGIENGAGGNRLVLRGRAENVTGESQSAIFGFPPRIEVADLPLVQPEIILDRDAAPLTSLHPRIAEDISVIWPLPPDWSTENISLTFFRQQFKLHDNLYGKAGWLGFAPAARLVVERPPQ